MEAKKSKKADLEKDISTYFSVGLIIAISLSLIAFEWTSDIKRGSIIRIDKGEPIEEQYLDWSMEPEKEKIEIPVVPPEIFEIIKDDIPLDLEIDWGTDIIKESHDISWTLPEITDEPEVDEETYLIPGEMPQFQGGDLNNFAVWSQKNIIYPAIAADNNVEGKVYLTFIVEKDGKLSNIQILKGADSALNNEAKRVIESSPLWTPGTNNGIPVRVRCTIVINFVLQ